MKQFFLLGAMKSGTTFLTELLSQHPEICTSSPKEPEFFMDESLYDNGKKFYLSEYYNSGEEATYRGDTQSKNLLFPWVPGRIKNLFPDAKLLVLIRNPVDRLFSHYLHQRRHGREDRSLTKALFDNYQRLRSGRVLTDDKVKKRYQEAFDNDERWPYYCYLEMGYYHQQIQRYLDCFDDSQLKIIQFQNLTERPAQIAESIFQFLKLEQFTPESEVKKNRSKIPRYYGLTKLFESLGKLSIADYIPNKFKASLKKINLRGKKNAEMSILTQLWLEQHYKEETKSLESYLEDSFEDWYSLT
ncbi:MAG: sulfotransferase [bacterium]